MSLTGKICDLLAYLTREDIEALTPAERQRLAHHCKHVASLAERPTDTLPRYGVLAALKDGQRGHGL